MHPPILASGWSFCTCQAHCWYFSEVAKLSFCQIPLCHPQQARKRGKYPDGRPNWDINKQHKLVHTAKKCDNNSHHHHLCTYVCTPLYVCKYAYNTITHLECHKYYVHIVYVCTPQHTNSAADLSILHQLTEEENGLHLFLRNEGPEVGHCVLQW